MNYETLKERAAQILSFQPEDGYEVKSFTTRSGGIPKNLAKIEVIEKGEEFQYDTTANGAAYSGYVAVECKEVGLDSDGQMIYATPSGKVFVYKYAKGSPRSFDAGYLADPEF